MEHCKEQYIPSYIPDPLTDSQGKVPWTTTSWCVLLMYIFYTLDFPTCQSLRRGKMVGGGKYTLVKIDEFFGNKFYLHCNTWNDHSFGFFFPGVL